MYDFKEILKVNEANEVKQADITVAAFEAVELSEMSKEITYEVFALDRVEKAVAVADEDNIDSVSAVLGLPVEANESALEKVKNFFKRIWEGIKKAVNTLITKVKNFFAKLVIWFKKITGLTTKKKLDSSLNRIKTGELVLDKKEIESDKAKKVASKLLIQAYAFNGTINGTNVVNYVNDVLANVKAYIKSNEAAGVEKLLLEIVDEINKVDSKADVKVIKSKIAAINKLYSSYEKILKGPFYKELASKVETDYKKSVVAPGGVSFRKALFLVEEGEGDNAKIDTYQLVLGKEDEKKIVDGAKAFTLTPKEIEALSKSYADVEEIVNKDLDKLVKDIDTYNKAFANISKKMDAIVKELDSKEDNVEGEKQLVREVISTINKITTKISVQRLVSLVEAVRSIYVSSEIEYYLNASIANYKAANK